MGVECDRTREREDFLAGVIIYYYISILLLLYSMSEGCLSHISTTITVDLTMGYLGALNLQLMN